MAITYIEHMFAIQRSEKISIIDPSSAGHTLVGMDVNHRRASILACMTVGGILAACSSTGSGDSATGQQAGGTAAIVNPASTSQAPAPSDAPATTAAAPQTAPEPTTTQAATTTTVAERPMRAGAERMHFEVGPLRITPGQNNITTAQGEIPQPKVDGYITRIAPNLRYADGTVPAVDVIHLHHGVWLNLGAHDPTSARLPERFFAAGEEKTVSMVPEGYGYPYKTSDRWILNYMLHNLTPKPSEVWITYDIDFIPADAPEAANLTAARPVWMDVQNGSIYPVFDVIKGTGEQGKYTYPTDAAGAYANEPAPKNEWTVDRDGVLLSTAGHLHPGGLHTDLYARRGSDSAHLFTSDAVYFEPAGAVSWDVSMTSTRTDWRVAVKAGDVLSTTATYDSGRASWYESMGIMVLWMADAIAPADPVEAASDPFVTKVDLPGDLTHGHLAENDHHGGEADPAYIDPAAVASVDAQSPIEIADFIYGQGDMLLGSPIPTVKAGQTMTFDNLDAPLENGLWHTLTACKAPCNGATGIAYPLADADITFDSGEMGDAGPPTSGNLTWTTPADLAPGDYTYFCRIHPFMRGTFRIAAPD